MTIPFDDTPADASDVAGGVSERLVEAARELAAARDLPSVIDGVRRAARAVSGADGATFVLREGDIVRYADEDSIAPLWKGRRFPMAACISGWAMLHRETVVIEDVFLDDRIPHDVYRTTYVKSLAMVPVVCNEPIAAIGSYWARTYRPSRREIRDLEHLAALASVALVNVKLVAELRAAVRARDEFIAIASHELRSPLTAAQLQVQLASRALDGAAGLERIRAALDRAQRSTTRVASVIEHLLGVPHQAQRPPPLILEPVGLAAVARAVVDQLSDPNPSTCIELVVEADSCGTWDRFRVHQLVENLLTNAVKFGCGLPVSVRVGRDGVDALLVVADRGIGIAPDDQARIFEPFERAVSTRNYGGFGLGLWIARQAAEAHGGSIRVDSRPSEGATFTVRLPLAPPG